MLLLILFLDQQLLSVEEGVDYGLHSIFDSSNNGRETVMPPTSLRKTRSLDCFKNGDFPWQNAPGIHFRKSQGASADENNNLNKTAKAALDTLPQSSTTNCRRSIICRQ